MGLELPSSKNPQSNEIGDASPLNFWLDPCRCPTVYWRKQRLLLDPSLSRASTLNLIPAHKGYAEQLQLSFAVVLEFMISRLGLVLLHEDPEVNGPTDWLSELCV